MLRLAFIATFLLSSFVHAADTSGCSPMIIKSQQKTTVNNAFLSLTSTKARTTQCWNMNQTGFALSYTWDQKDERSQFAHVNFWVRVNGAEQFISSDYIKCEDVTSHGRYTTQQHFNCTAHATVHMNSLDTWSIEVAPETDGKWDTKGVGQNYFFEL